MLIHQRVVYFVRRMGSLVTPMVVSNSVPQCLGGAEVCVKTSSSFLKRDNNKIKKLSTALMFNGVSFAFVLFAAEIGELQDEQDEGRALLSPA